MQHWSLLPEIKIVRRSFCLLWNSVGVMSQACFDVHIFGICQSHERFFKCCHWKVKFLYFFIILSILFSFTLFYYCHVQVPASIGIETFGYICIGHVETSIGRKFGRYGRMDATITKWTEQNIFWFLLIQLSTFKPTNDWCNNYCNMNATITPTALKVRLKYMDPNIDSSHMLGSA